MESCGGRRELSRHLKNECVYHVDYLEEEGS